MKGSCHQAMFDEAKKAIEEDDSTSQGQKNRGIEALGVRPSPLLLTVVGTAGSGKSFVINTVADALTLKYTDASTRATKPAVLIGAPTGLAAVQIGGSTIHSMLSIEVQHGRDAAIRPLKPQRLNALRIQVSLAVEKNSM